LVVLRKPSLGSQVQEKLIDCRLEIQSPKISQTTPVGEIFESY
jgi:hypothetical protein